MKKSSFLQNSKDMLSKSFKPAKCKTALKLASSRIKLMKNRKEVLVKQMKRELAHLLESGQDQTARIRVEHVIREEKMMAAYELLEIYCELIVARLPIIETQKNCPIDLKEAIASAMFASPRCGDIPELSDVKKQFTAKYGKEFTSAAVELRPDCGVSRMLIEKLSAKAPDGQTKIKVLTAIAEEHNIKWDPKSLGESELLASNDLLNGPSTPKKINKMQDEAPNLAAPDVQAPPSYQVMYNHRLNSSEQSSQTSENFYSTQNSGRTNIVSSTSNAERGPSGPRVERVDGRKLHVEEGNASSFGHQSWNMNFEDATAAAQAAAESAERASMAARAAAELSSRASMTRQHYAEAQKSKGHVLRDDEIKRHSSSKFTNDYSPRVSKHSTSNFTNEYRPKDSTHFASNFTNTKESTHSASNFTNTKESTSSYVSDRHPRVQNDQMDSSEPGNGERISESIYHDGMDRGRRSPKVASSRSKASSNNDNFLHNLEEVENYPIKNSRKEEVNRAEASTWEKYSKDGADSENHLEEGFTSEMFNHFAEEGIREQSGINSSTPHSTTAVGDGKYSSSGHRVFGYESIDNPSIDFDGNSDRDSLPASPRDAAVVAFDESASDDDDFRVGMSSPLNEVSNIRLSLNDRNQPAHLSADLFEASTSHQISESEIFNRRDSFPEFSENLEGSMHDLQPDDFRPITFDDSDGPSSDSETDNSHSVPSGAKNFSHSHSDNNKLVGTERSSPTEMHKENNPMTSIESSEKIDFHGAPTSHSSPKLGISQPESNATGGNSYFQNSGYDEKHVASLQPRVSEINEVEDNVVSPQSYRIPVGDENSGNDKELNFEKLKGGFRQKGHPRPPYMKSQFVDVSSSSKREADDNSKKIPQPNNSPAEQFSSIGRGKESGETRRSRIPTKDTHSDSDIAEQELEKELVSRERPLFIHNVDRSVEKGNILGETRRSRMQSYDTDSDSDNPEKELKKKLVSHERQPYTQNTDKNVVSKPRLRGSVTYFDTGSSDSENDSTKQILTGKGPQGSGVSRRTKTSPKGTASVSQTKVHAASWVLPDTKRNTSVYGAETPQFKSRTTHSSEFVEPNQSSSAKGASTIESNISLQEERQESSRPEQHPSSKQKIDSSKSAESQKTTSGRIISRENSEKKASHVHPKLPDYDTLAARVQALRMDRQ